MSRSLLRTTERTKRCPRCQTVKPWSDYTARARWDDGTVRNVQANCKACNAALCREWRRTRGEHPDKRRARQNRWLANLDPERKAVILDRQKVWWRRKAGTTPDRYRPERRQRRGPTLPVAPFAAWLSTLGSSPAVIARATELNERRIHSVIKGEQERVEMDTVDRALLAVGDGTTLEDLYDSQELAA